MTGEIIKKLPIHLPVSLSMLVMLQNQLLGSFLSPKVQVQGEIAACCGLSVLLLMISPFLKV